MNEIIINRSKRFKLSQYKYIYVLTFNGSKEYPSISLQKFPIIYINKKYLYYKENGDDMLKVLNCSLKTEEDDLLESRIKKWLEYIFTNNDKNFYKIFFVDNSSSIEQWKNKIKILKEMVYRQLKNNSDIIKTEKIRKELEDFKKRNRE